MKKIFKILLFVTTFCFVLSGVYAGVINYGDEIYLESNQWKGEFLAVGEKMGYGKVIHLSPQKWKILSVEDKTGSVKRGDKIALQPLELEGSGKFLRVGGPLNEYKVNLADQIDKWEKWTIICPEFPSGDVESGNIINLKSFHEKYLRARDYNEVNQADEAQDWEKWVITKD